MFILLTHKIYLLRFEYDAMPSRWCTIRSKGRKTRKDLYKTKCVSTTESRESLSQYCAKSSILNRERANISSVV